LGVVAIRPEAPTIPEPSNHAIDLRTANVTELRLVRELVLSMSIIVSASGARQVESVRWVVITQCTVLATSDLAWTQAPRTASARPKRERRTRVRASRSHQEQRRLRFAAQPSTDLTWHRHRGHNAQFELAHRREPWPLRSLDPLRIGHTLADGASAGPAGSASYGPHCSRLTPFVGPPPTQSR
jgi:hypothetical protein